MCWKCGKTIVIEGSVVGRSAVCDQCDADVRSCRNCAFYSPGSFHDCAERVEDAVKDKERANFCDTFRLNPGVSATSAGKKPDRSAFNNLFES